MGNKVMPNEVLYHIGISAEMLKGAEYALLPGDPGRVEALARALGTAEPVGCHREYTSWLADVEGTSVLVCSTGMGGAFYRKFPVLLTACTGLALCLIPGYILRLQARNDENLYPQYGTPAHLHVGERIDFLRIGVRHLATEV